MSPLVQFVQNNLLLIAVAVISGAMLLWPLFRRGSRRPVGHAGAGHAHDQPRGRAGRGRARSGRVRRRAHPRGKNVPLARVEEGANDLAKRKERPLIVYCDTGTNRAAKAIGALKKQGFAKVVNLSGGIGAWQQAGLPVEK
jgi:rhodanese-related sulfurtransferase